MKYEHNDCNALPAPESDVTSTQMTLTDNFAKINERKQQAVIKFRNKETDPWYIVKLMLYYPWFDEQADLLGQYATYEEHYRQQIHESRYR